MKKIKIIFVMLILSFFLFSCKKEYQVNLHIDDEVVSLKVEKNGQIDYNNPLKDGYKFVGWYTDEAYQNEYKIEEKVLKNLDLYAKFLKIYKVTIFNGESEEVIEVLEGERLGKLDDIEKEGYKFYGWYQDINCTTLYDFDNIVISDFTIYAKLEMEKYTVSFITNGDSIQKPLSVKAGAAVKAPSNPSKLGYKFSYWASDIEGREKYDFSTPVTSDITLYAFYEEINYEEFLDNLIPEVITDDLVLPTDDGENEYSWSSTNVNILNASGIYSPRRTDTTITIFLEVNNSYSSETLKFERKVTVKGYNLEKLESGKIVIGYTSSWYYQRYSDVLLDTVDILDLSFAYVNGDGTLDLKDIASIMTSVISQAHKKGKRVVLSIQGSESSATHSTQAFSDCAASSTLREKLATSIVETIDKYHFDGVDIDWEYPGTASRPVDVDRTNFTYLMAEIRSKLNSYGKDYLLTSAIPGGRDGYSRFEMKKLVDYFDYFNMMSYDLVSNSKGSHHSALYKSSIMGGTLDGCSIDETVKLWEAQGVPSNKICLGMAFYSKSITVRTDRDNGIGVIRPIGSVVTYKNVTYEKLITTEFPLLGTTSSYYYDESSCAPTIINSSKLFYTYDNERSLIEKCHYATTNNLAGVMIWELGEDHTDTLIKAVGQGMGKVESNDYIATGYLEKVVNEKLNLKFIREVEESSLKENVKIIINNQELGSLNGNTLTLLKEGTLEITVMDPTNDIVYSKLIITIK